MTEVHPPADSMSRPAAGSFPQSSIDWSAVWCGALTATAISFVLLTFGTGLGLAVASPSASWRDTSALLYLLSGLWLLLTSLASFGLGGYLSGCLLEIREGESPDEAGFRDGVHGLSSWALAVMLGAFLTFAGASALNERASANAPSRAATESLLAVELDQLFRSERKPTDPSDPEMRAQVARILVSAAGRSGLGADDRVYLERMVEARTGLARPEAEARVTQILAKAKDAVSHARRGGVILAFMISASLVIGAAVAWIAAIGAGQHRGKMAELRFWRRWEVDRLFRIQ